MIEQRFYVSSEERMNTVKTFIRQNMPTARFKSNPYKHTDGTWEFNVSYELSDMDKLTKLLNKFYYEDNPPIPAKKSLWKRIKRWFFN